MLLARQEAEALKIRSESEKLAGLAEAEVLCAQVEAKNLRSDAMIGLELGKARLAAQPGILVEMVKPAAKINVINIHQLGWAAVRAGAPGTSSNPAPLIQALDAIMGMGVQMPALQEIGKTVGANVRKSLATETDIEEKSK